MAKPFKALCFDSKIGSSNIDLFDGNYWYAELSLDYRKKDFKALGGLPYKHKLKFTYKGKSKIGMKGDVGAGGPGHEKVALHINLAKALNYPCGKDDVYIKNV